ncbi:MAG: molybdenum cofactor biosynthesis protein MoaE [Leptolyngbya sp. PLA3]|nr:MAG: molybdenum cofactor biosynthesis protein MoaE [Cyanobacteria bacterium CYA]MCE7969963.1 molybdenum cofactor biosynthesis protein MoaE [Leptolyngbya sp. PL-A3]
MEPPTGVPERTVSAVIVDGPLTAPAESAAVSPVHAAQLSGAIGATLRFEGIVRREEADADCAGAVRELAALEYQTYDPMAQHELEHLARRVAARHGLRSLAVLHSRGSVPVGQVSFVLIVTAAHRAEAIAGLTEFIDRMKQDVPIWKHPVWKSAPEAAPPHCHGDPTSESSAPRAP